MTRGILAVIFLDSAYRSTEFNGDMYREGRGHGLEAVQALLSIHDYESYRKAVLLFDSRNFGYAKEDGNDSMVMQIPVENAVDMRRGNYSATFQYTDYTYIRNLTGRDIDFQTDADEKVRVRNGAVAVFDFGKYLTAYDHDPVISNPYLAGECCPKTEASNPGYDATIRERERIAGILMVKGYDAKEASAVTAFPLEKILDIKEKVKDDTILNVDIPDMEEYEKAERLVIQQGHTMEEVIVHCMELLCREPGRGAADLLQMLQDWNEIPSTNG